MSFWTAAIGWRVGRLAHGDEERPSSWLNGGKGDAYHLEADSLTEAGEDLVPNPLPGRRIGLEGSVQATADGSDGGGEQGKRRDTTNFANCTRVLPVSNMSTSGK